MKRLIFILLACAAVAGCQSTPPPDSGFATLRVSVVAEPKIGVKTAGATEPSSDTYAGPGISDEGPFALVNYAALEDVVVWLEPAGAAPAPPPVLEVRIDAERAFTGLTVAGVGQTLMFRNRGGKAANFYSVSDGNDFDLHSLAPGAGAAYVVKSSGVIEVLCDSLAQPVAVIFIAPSPLVRLTQSGSTVEFRNIPPGQYVVRSWHRRLPGHKTAVEVPVNQITNTKVTVGVNGLPTVGPR